MMSCRVILSAVAVRAMTGTPANRSRIKPNWAYSGRKSWPHWLMQWASSMANRLMEMVLSRKGASAMSFSGDI